MNNNPYGKRNLEMGKKVAYQSGAELQANPGESRREYLDTAAFYFREDVNFYKDLTDKEKKALNKEFDRGIAAEKELTGKQ